MIELQNSELIIVDQLHISKQTFECKYKSKISILVQYIQNRGSRIKSGNYFLQLTSYFALKK